MNFNLNTRRHILEYLTAVRTLDLTLCTFCCSCGTTPQSEMVSRRRILSRSRDDLNLDSTYVMQEEEEDVWYQRDKLYKVRATSALQLIGFNNNNNNNIITVYNICDRFLTNLNIFYKFYWKYSIWNFTVILQAGSEFLPTDTKMDGRRWWG